MCLLVPTAELSCSVARLLRVRRAGIAPRCRCAWMIPWRRRTQVTPRRRRARRIGRHLVVPGVESRRRLQAHPVSNTRSLSPILTTPDAPCQPLLPGDSGLPLLLGRTALADSTAHVNSTVLAVAAASVDSMATANSTAPSESIASLDSIEPSDPAAAARGAAG